MPVRKPYIKIRSSGELIAYSSVCTLLVPTAKEKQVTIIKIVFDLIYSDVALRA